MIMKRRDFFKGMAGAGVLVATSQLPSFGQNLSLAAQDDPSVFPDRGRYERLSLTFATVEIGLEKPFSILHISDTHLTAAYPYENAKKQKLHTTRTRTFGGHQEEALRDSLAWAREKVDYVLHTGDLIDWQSEANFDLVRKYFGDNMTGCMGNHEFSPDMGYSEPGETPTEEFKDLSREALSKAYPFDISFSSQVVNGVNFIMIDDVYGTVTPEQVSRFRAEAAKGLPMVLCMHVPFYTPGIWRATKRFWQNKDCKFSDGKVPAPSGAWRRQQEDPVTRDFIACLREEPLLKAILAGHEHITVQDRFSETAMEYVVSGNFLFAGQEVLFV